MILQDSTGKTFVQKLINAIDAHLDDEKFGVSELAAELGMSRVTLHRKVKEVVNKSVSAFIREIRLKRAYELLQNKSLTVSEIAYQVGFSSATYFNKCFHDYFGKTPGDVQKGNYKNTEIERESGRTKHKIVKKEAIYLLIILFITFIGYVLYNNFFKEKSPKKIALVPSILLDSTFSDNSFLTLIDENLHRDLHHLNDFSVIPSPDMNRFRNTKKGSSEIASEVNADYILYVKVVFAGKDSLIIYELIDKTLVRDKDEYPFFPSDPESIAEVSDKITEKIARKLNTVLKPEELKQIKARATKNRAAQSYYMQGILYSNLLKTSRKYEYMTGAKNGFFNAVKEDSTYGDAWLKLAKLYIGPSWYNMPNMFAMEQLNIREYNSKLDSGRIMLEKAEKYDVSDPYELISVKSVHNYNIGNFKSSKLLWDEMWKDRKNDANYFLSLSSFYANQCNYYDALKYRLKYLESVSDTSFIDIGTYRGFISLLGYLTDHADYALEFAKIKYHQDHEFEWYQSLKIPAMSGGNYERLNEYSKNLYDNDSIKNISRTFYMLTSFVLGKYEEAYKLLQERDSIFEANGLSHSPQVYSVWLYNYFGNKEKCKAEYARILENSVILSNTVYVPYNEKQRIYFQLSAVYSFLGEKELAYTCLEKLSDFKTIQAFLLRNIEMIPHYDNIRNEPRFQNILSSLKNKFYKEHKRMEELLNSKMDKIREKFYSYGSL